MNRKDKQTAEMLKSEFGRAVSQVEIPERLKKENIVEMLKNGESKAKDFSVETEKGTKKNIIYLKRIAALAAAFVLITAAAAVIRLGTGSRIFGISSAAGSGFETETPLRSIKDLKELEHAVRKIISHNEKETGTEAQKKKGSYVASSVPEAHGNGAVVSDKATGEWEADIVKNDGEYLYIVTTGYDETAKTSAECIKIVRAVPPENLSTVSTIVLAESSGAEKIDECFDIHLKGDCLIALMKRYAGSGDSDSTAAVFYDISDPTAPVKIKELVQDGSFISSKLYGNKLCLITSRGIAASSVIPSLRVNGIEDPPAAQDILVSVNDPDASCLFITVTDLGDQNAPVSKTVIFGSGSNVYCAADSVYITRNFVSVNEEESEESKSLTEVYRFSVGADGIGDAGSIVLEGSVPAESFMNELDGNLRIAAVNGEGGSIFILNSKAEICGKAENVFKASEGLSMSFIGEKAYVYAGSEMTVIDFSDIEAPETVSSASVRGFEGELFKISETGYVGIEQIASSGKAVIRLFDLSDPFSPKAVSEYVLEADASFSPEEYSKGIVLIPDKEEFGIPVIKTDSENGGDKSEYMVFSTAGGTIALAGEFTHEPNFIGDAAARGACIGDSFFTVSGEKAAAFSLSGGTEISDTDIR